MRKILLGLVLFSVSACSKGLPNQFPGPASLGFKKGSSAEAVLAATKLEQLRAETYNARSQQLMFRHIADDQEFLAHYYFYSRNRGLSGIAYYRSDKPYDKCERHQELYAELVEEFEDKYGKSIVESDLLTTKPNQPWNCNFGNKWKTHGMEVEVFRDGNKMHDFERVGVRYTFPMDRRE